jgi:hypothetical protein
VTGSPNSRSSRRQAGQWDRGPEPKDRSGRNAWRKVDDTVEQVQRRLGRSIDRDRDRGRGAGLEL